MDNSVQNQERVPENLNKLLAVAVRSIQWSYAIFWSLSSKQHGVLEWKEGYYNGDIKTRKTVQATELKADKVGIQRSQQLRELYESLLEGETDEESKRPNASLSPEDLTDSEWYYLVCMSFVFVPGEGLPGRTLASGEAIWLCDAHQVDSKIFSRSLLAKSASIQTVVCFPHLGGVIELGVTEKVLEDHSLIQHIKASLLEFSKPVCSDKSSSRTDNENDGKDPIFAKLDYEQADKIQETKFNLTVYNELEGTNDEDYTTSSSDDSDQTEEDSKLDRGSSNSILSLYFEGKNIKNHHPEEFQERSIEFGTNEDLHYQRTIFDLLKNSRPSIRSSCLSSCRLKSSFLSCKKGGKIINDRKIVQGSILKKILFNVPLMYGGFSVKSTEENGKIDVKNGLMDKRIENEKFRLLGSMVPSMSKIDKATILDDTIDYLKGLKSRILALESCSDVSESEARTGPTFPEMVEHISDNYNSMPRVKKRKACDIYETDMDPNEAAVSKKGPPFKMEVHINEHEVLIEMTCRSREYILLDIIEAVNNLNLDAHSVQSQILDGVLSLTLKSKKKYNTEKHDLKALLSVENMRFQVQGSAVASARKIKQELRKVAGKC